MPYKQPKPIGKIKRNQPSRSKKRYKLPIHFLTILTIIILIVVVIASIHSYYYYYRNKAATLKTAQKKYRHFELVKFNFDSRDRSLDKMSLLVFVERNNKPIDSIGGKKAALLKYNPRLHIYEATWPVPWNAPGGLYTAKLTIPRGKDKPRIVTTGFEIERIKPPAIKPGIGVLTLESSAMLETAKIKSPDGDIGNWENIIKWADYLTADTIWYLAGQTASWGARIDNNSPWIQSNINFVPKFAKAAHAKGLKFGVWVACFLTFGDTINKANYQFAYNYDRTAGTCVPTRSISIGDQKRRADIIKLLTRLANTPAVDYIGLDYIRNAIGGYEMVDQFVGEMNPELPENWAKLGKMGRMCWLGKEIQKRQKMKLVDQWNWWRAHYMATMVKEIIAKVNTTKPLWCFTLSWEKGWQHGQDPIMMNDAGAAVDAVMLYECNRGQFNDLLKEWNRYVGKNQVNLFGGDVVDFNLHQFTVNPPGPQEFYDRMMLAHHKMSGDGRIKGMFWHDLARGLWGRLGPYSINEWAIVGAASFTGLRNDWGLLDVTLSLEAPEKLITGKNQVVHVNIKNISSVAQRNVRVNYLAVPYMSCNSAPEQVINTIAPGETRVIPFSLNARGTDSARARQNMVAFSCTWDSHAQYHKAVSFKYLRVE
ncbi:MAG: hypothetical protein PHD29_08360 [bacterium]|nr:hypothetical protein [bacterium]MDD5353919.1 hypothetical protein [bacterium]MDD5755770.1 hypothetical protein [bacterium]